MGLAGVLGAFLTTCALSGGGALTAGVVGWVSTTAVSTARPTAHRYLFSRRNIAETSHHITVAALDAAHHERQPEGDGLDERRVDRPKRRLHLRRFLDQVVEVCREAERAADGFHLERGRGIHARASTTGKPPDKTLRVVPSWKPASVPPWPEDRAPQRCDPSAGHKSMPTKSAPRRAAGKAPDGLWPPGLFLFTRTPQDSTGTGPRRCLPRRPDLTLSPTGRRRRWSERSRSLRPW